MAAVVEVGRDQNVRDRVDAAGGVQQHGVEHPHFCLGVVRWFEIEDFRIHGLVDVFGGGGFRRKQVIAAAVAVAAGELRLTA